MELQHLRPPAELLRRSTFRRDQTSGRPEVRASRPPVLRSVIPTCVDRYEDSIWDLSGVTSAKTRQKLVAEILDGSVTLNDLTTAGATQFSFADSSSEVIFPKLKSPSAPLFAASIKGVMPITRVTWLQAEVACRLSGKRLPTNEEWTAAALGTPNPDTDDQSTTCVTNSNSEAHPTGTRSACVSRWGNYDMVGNVWERTSEWVIPPAEGGTRQWGSEDDTIQDDMLQFNTDPGMDAFVRGGDYQSAGAAVFSPSRIFPWMKERTKTLASVARDRRRIK